MNTRIAAITASIVILAAIAMPEHEWLGGSSVDILPAFELASLCLLAFLVGHLFMAGGFAAKRAKVVSLKSAEEIPLVQRFQSIYVVLAMIGLATTIVQVHLTVGFPAYVSMLLSGGESLTQLRADAFSVSSSSAGLPGAFKLLCSLPTLAMFYNVPSISHVWRNSMPDRLRSLIVILAFLFNNLLRMDRLSYLLIAFPTVRLLSSLQPRRRLVVLALCAVGATIADTVSRLRASELGLLGYVHLYVQSGFVNLALLINTLDGHTYGLNSIFCWLPLIGRAAGVPIDVPYHGFDWIWNNAQNGIGYLYVDFGFWAIPISMLIGGLCGFVDYRVARGVAMNRVGWERIQDQFSYAIVSMIAVPAFAGGEFYFGLLVSIFLDRYSSVQPGRAQRRLAGVST